MRSILPLVEAFLPLRNSRNVEELPNDEAFACGLVEGSADFGLIDCLGQVLVLVHL
jgi:hypothetical protein